MLSTERAPANAVLASLQATVRTHRAGSVTLSLAMTGVKGEGKRCALIYLGTDIPLLISLLEMLPTEASKFSFCFTVSKGKRGPVTTLLCIWYSWGRVLIRVSHVFRGGERGGDSCHPPAAEVLPL